MSSAGNSLVPFLFQGQPPQVSTGSSSSGPAWLSDAMLGTVNAATQLAGQPYQQFQGPTVASPSAQTQRAWGLAGSNVGSYQPYLQQAGALTQAAAAPITSNDVSQFLNPYSSYITGALTQNLNQNILPGVQDKFVGAGQSRSPQEAQVTSNAVRDTNTSIGQSLAGAYQGAVNSLLQQRQQQGQLGSQYGQLGALGSQLGAQDVSQLSAAGQAQDTLAQQNLNAAQSQFQQQQQYPYQQIGFLSNVLNGIPLQAAGTSSSSTGTYYPQYSSGLSSAAGGASALSGLGYRSGGHVAKRKSGALTRAAKRR